MDLDRKTPNFINKLWGMVNNSDPEIISWSESGKSFLIKNQIDFIMRLLPSYFKHRNMGSFVRQLNMYDFHKIACTGDNQDENILEFYHKFFMEDQPDQLVHITRKLRQHPQPLCNCRSNADRKTKEIADLRNKLEITESNLCLERKKQLILLRNLKELHASHSAQTAIMKRIVEFMIQHCQGQNNNQGNETKFAKKMFDFNRCIELNSAKVNAVMDKRNNYRLVPTADTTPNSIPLKEDDSSCSSNNEEIEKILGEGLLGSPMDFNTLMLDGDDFALNVDALDDESLIKTDL